MGFKDFITDALKDGVKDAVGDILDADKGKKPPADRPDPPGQDLEILVAPRGSAAHDAATRRAGDAVVAERKLFRAFDRAAEHLNTQGPCTVTLRIAGGEYTGKARTGTWLVPRIDAPGSTFRVLGGHADDWSARAPFHRPSRLVISAERSAPVFQLERESKLRELYLSGLTIDAGPGNVYDRQDNLVASRSASYEILAFSYLAAERLVIADNVFVNAPHRVAETLVRAPSDDAEVIVRNNLVLNNVFAWRVRSASGPHKPRRYAVEHNSFILNWPRTPDKTTGSTGAIEIGNRHTAGEIDLRGNLFAYNVGGAIFPGYEDTVGPPIQIRENLFWGNGTLFETDDPGGAAVVGKFNRSGTYGTFDLIDIEDNFTWPTADNQVLDPGLRVQIKEFKPIDSGRQRAPIARADAAEDPFADLDLDALDGRDGDVDDLLGVDDLLDIPDDHFDDLSFEDDAGGEFRPENFAARLYVEAGAMPFPTVAEAGGYGASPDRVEQL